MRRRRGQEADVRAGGFDLLILYLFLNLCLTFRKI